jgi:hypothetical protein
MDACTAIKGNGERCRGIPIHGTQWCVAHHPQYDAARKQGGVKGGKRGGRGRPSTEIHMAKSEIRRVIDAIEAGDIETRKAAVMFQGWNLILRALETERNIKETEELAAMVEQLWEQRSEPKRRVLSGGPRL